MVTKISPSTQVPQDIIIPFPWIAKILKVPVFRLSLGDDLFSQISISVHNFFSRICQGQSQALRSFDPAIAQRSADRFITLGAKIQFVIPRDKKGQVQMMTFQAQDLEEKIQALNGSWERKTVNGRQVLAIVPPSHECQKWIDFKEKLCHFHWQEEQGMLITCDCADAIPINAPKKCFLLAHSTSNSFTSEWRRAGFYIGAKQDLCFFDNGNTWKNTGRPPSEKSFYLEIEAVYEKIKDNYSYEHLWVGGNCGGAPVAAYLKQRFHEHGINFFAEQSFSNLDDFVKPIFPFSFLASIFAPRIKGSLEDEDLSTEIQEQIPSCQFSVEELWKDLDQYKESFGGKLILVEVREDEHISELAYERYFALAKKVNSIVKHILYTSNIGWHHSDNFFYYEAPRRSFIQAVFE